METTKAIHHLAVCPLPRLTGGRCLSRDLAIWLLPPLIPPHRPGEVTGDCWLPPPTGGPADIALAVTLRLCLLFLDPDAWTEGDCGGP